jgi:hypothetical protein
MLLGSLRGAIFCGPLALKRLEEAIGASELEFEGDFVAEEGVAFRGGFEGEGGSHRGVEGIGEARHGFVHGDGLGLNDLEPSPMGDGHDVDESSFSEIAGLQAGEKTGAEVNEGCGGILIEGWVVGGEAVASAVAGGIALALGGDRSFGSGAVGAGGFDLFWGPHSLRSIG